MKLKRLLMLTACVAGLAGSPPWAAADSRYYGAPEPSAEIAATWWPPLRNVWTPVGWKNHPFRFTVLYNGTIVANPHPLPMILDTPIKRYLSKYQGLGIQLTMTPSADGALPDRPEKPYRLSSLPDMGLGHQGWTDNATPVLWTDWPANFFYGNHGLVVRQETFAHVPGGEVKTGQEPIYAWVRLSIRHVDQIQAPKMFHVLIHLGKDEQISRSMFVEDNLTVQPALAIYPRELRREAFQDGPQSACRLLEPDGSVRLIGQTETGAIELVERTPGSRDYFLKVTLPVVQGNHADLLVPMIPGAADAVERERALGYDAALAQCDAAWSRMPRTAAVIDTPEPKVNQAIREQARLAQVISEINPENGERSLLTGSWNYDTLWPTPALMTAHMLMDVVGYHDFVAENLEIFRKYQGSRKPPGPSYTLHPGYFCAPRELSSVDWLTDHGSVLHAVCQHALYTDDQAFIGRWLESVVKACDFIKDSRAMTGHGGVPGVLPPAVATDADVPSQAAWNIAWNYKGLASAVRLLRRIEHPRAEEFAEEARQYREVFVKAFRDHVSKAAQWTDDSGRSHPIVSTALAGDDNIIHPFFLDTGPLSLAFAGLLEGDDPLMKESLAFYREGPYTKLYDPLGNMHQRAILTHEVSSCEPCYSFNNFCSWQSGDREHFLEGMYGLLSASLSSQTFIGCEHRHGIYGLPAPGALMVTLMRLAVIDDQLEPGKLHLTRLTPLAWIRKDYETRFENMPTEFGPVGLRFKLSDNGKALVVHWQADFREQPEAILLHVPPVEGLKKVIVNGRTHRARPGETIQLN